MPIEARREQVLDATLRLIGERGYSAATMEAIAREADIAKPVVYDAYPSRGQLLRALLEREEARALDALAEAMPMPEPGTDPDPDAVAIAAVRAFLQAVHDNPTAWRLMLLPTDGMPEIVGEHVDAGRAVALEGVRSLMAWGIEKRGEVAADFDVEVASRAIYATVEHAARLVLSDPGEFPPERFAEFFATLLRALPR